MNTFYIFIEILNKSVEKNGADTPLTLGHLRNIANLAVKIQEKNDTKLREAWDEIEMDIRRYGSD
jgi:hypothetical protein